MPTLTMEQQLEAIQDQLETIRVNLETRDRRLAEFEELKDDLARIVNDLTRAAIEELDDLTPFVRTGDFAALVKRLLRSTNRISDSVTTLESAASFVEDVRPITHDLFNQFIFRLDDLEQKGYFRLAGELHDLGDVTVRAAADSNVVPALRKAVQTASETDLGQFLDYSLWKMYKDFRSPEVRRAIGLLMVFMKTLGREMQAPESPQT